MDDTADASVMEFREDLKEIVKAVMEPAGATIDPEQVFEFATLLAALVFATASIAISWRRGMAPLGVGMGTAIFILVLFAGYRMLGTPLAWPVAARGAGGGRRRLRAGAADRSVPLGSRLAGILLQPLRKAGNRVVAGSLGLSPEVGSWPARTKRLMPEPSGPSCRTRAVARATVGWGTVQSNQMEAPL